jgi:hypothetical protein
MTSARGNEAVRSSRAASFYVGQLNRVPLSIVRLVSATGYDLSQQFRRLRARCQGDQSEGYAITSRRNLGQGMLFSGKLGATESPSAAFVGLNRGPLAFLLLGLGRLRCLSGATGGASDVSSAGREAFFFEPKIT